MGSCGFIWGYFPESLPLLKGVTSGSRNTTQLRGDGFRQKGRKVQLQGLNIEQLQLFPK